MQTKHLFDLILKKMGVFCINILLFPTFHSLQVLPLNNSQGCRLYTRRVHPNRIRDSLASRRSPLQNPKPQFHFAIAMAFRGSISRSLVTAARTSLRSSPPLPRAPTASTPRILPRSRFPFSPARGLGGELGCVQSLLTFRDVAAGLPLTSHPLDNARAFCELSQGT